MRRAIIALVTATALMLTGLIPGPLRVTALGETSVTLNCTDGTSLTLLVDADTLAGLTAAVQGMIDYPAGLSCTVVQNPLPLTTFFGHVALATNPNRLVVAGGRWQVPCSVILPPPPPPCDPNVDPNCETALPGPVVARGATRPSLASLISAAPATSCVDSPCVWVNIGANVHFRDNTTILEGTLNETIPEHQSCPNPNFDPNDPTSPATLDVGPSHFDSQPQPDSCLKVLNKRAFTTTYVRHVFGPAFTETAFPLVLNGPVHFSFFDFGNPSTFTPTNGDRLAGPPAADESNCDTAGPSGTEMPTYLLQNGNINVYGQT